MWNSCKFPECDNWTRRSDGDYCSYHERAERKEKELTQKQSDKRKALIEKQREKSKIARPKVNKVSVKRRHDSADYEIVRMGFLVTYPECQIKANEFCTNTATDIHHMAGRTGDLFLDITKWKSSCRSCHNYAHDHPKEAKEKGWSLSRLQTVKQTI